MELLFQVWDEVDDMLSVCAHVLARYGIAEVLVLASGAFGAIRRPIGNSIGNSIGSSIGSGLGSCRDTPKKLGMRTA